MGGTTTLSPSELLALRMKAEGCTTQEIAGMTATPVETVKSQLKQARVKLGAKNTPHAVWVAIEQGLLDPVSDRE